MVRIVKTTKIAKITRITIVPVSVKTFFIPHLYDSLFMKLPFSELHILKSKYSILTSLLLISVITNYKMVEFHPLYQSSEFLNQENETTRQFYGLYSITR